MRAVSQLFCGSGWAAEAKELRVPHPLQGPAEDETPDSFPPDERQALSRGFDQFHLAITLAMKNFHITFVIPEDKNVAVTELCFFHRFFEGHGAQGHRIRG